MKKKKGRVVYVPFKEVGGFVFEPYRVIECPGCFEILRHDAVGVASCLYCHYHWITIFPPFHKITEKEQEWGRRCAANWDKWQNNFGIIRISSDDE